MLMMRFRRLRVFSALTAAASLLVPADAHAIFGLCQKRQNAAAALYGGTVCNPCGQQLVCNYVPQTCYRTQTVTVPVTMMRPVCGADPCTGCPTTVMRPVVTYQQQVQYVPYSSYRLQYSVAQPACPTATTSYYAPAPSSGIGVATPTYAAPAIATPAATFAAPTLNSGCSSCNSGVAATSYYAPSTVAPAASYPVTTNYAPAPTTRMLTPGVVVPGAAGVAVQAPAGAYTYQSTPGSNANVSVGGYSYASPSASGIAPPATYGSSSFTPAYTAPAAAAPSYTTPAPSYSSPSYSTPVPSLSGSTVVGGATLSAPSLSSSPTTGSSYYPPSSGTTLSSPSNSGSISSSALAAGPLVPVPPATTVYSNPGTPTPAPSLSTPSLSIPSTTSPLVLPAPPTQSPYSSGVNPSKLPVQPIPDPEINRRTSTPLLIDPEDKTAMNFPIRRSVGYRAVYHVNGETKSVEVGVVPASYVTETPVAEYAQPMTAPTTAWQQPISQPVPSVATTEARLGAPRPAMEVQTVYVPQQPAHQQPAAQFQSQPATDRDGWSAASR